jgi:ATP-dependent DNA ligase
MLMSRPNGRVEKRTYTIHLTEASPEFLTHCLRHDKTLARDRETWGAAGRRAEGATRSSSVGRRRPRKRRIRLCGRLSRLSENGVLPVQGDARSVSVGCSTVEGTPMLHWPVKPVSAVPARWLPTSTKAPVVYEMKWDGFRAVVWRTAEGVRIQSRQGVDLTRFFPDLISTLTATLPARTVIDGEVLVWDTRRGRCSFSLLQRRLMAGRRLSEVVRRYPAHLVAFDLLRDGRGVDLLDQPLTTRRAKLERLLHNTPPQVVICPQTSDRDVALGWLNDLGVAGVEGVVIKPAVSRYRPGSQLWTKVRTRDTTEFIVGGVTGTLQRPATLLLGQFDDHGTFRFVGQTHPITAEHRQDLRRVLRGLPFLGSGAGHPWPCPLPAGWTPNFAERQPLAFIPVEPTVVTEVEVDTARDGPFGRLRHRGRLVRIRLDLQPADVTRSGAHTQPGQAVADASGPLADAGHH